MHRVLCVYVGGGQVCVKVIDALRSREKETHGEAVEGGALDSSFSLPRLSKVGVFLCVLFYPCYHDIS